MNEIIRHIEFLLVTNDCVVIPGLGAVLAHSLPARYDQARTFLMPPSRTFSFNVSLTHNDGLLVSSVARSKSISFEAARNFVAGEVEAMKRKLSADGVLPLGEVGLLKMSDGSVLSFEPGRVSSLSPQYMWLPELELCPVTDLARRRSQAADSSQTERRATPVNYLYRAVRVAASFAILLALGFVLTTPIKFDKAQYASLGIENFTPAHNQASAQSSSSLMRRPGESTGVVKLYLRSYDDASEIADTAAHAAYIREHIAKSASAESNIQPDNESALRFDANDRYYLIVASLPSEADADDYIAHSNNQQLGILAKDGRYRVYAATGANLREAQSAAETLA
ncbi:MAG: hypothetical protein K2K94_07230, partial [Muribaculaceae bacterium]|nr:hypothetical protein [Muribaculaceae bacterium]